MSLAPVRVHAHVGQGDAVRLQTNLRDVDACLYPQVFAALGVHLGLDPVELRKAVTPAGSGTPDPRYPALTVLARQARRNWDRYGKDLVAKVTQLLADGKLLPLTAENEALLLELFRDHEVRLVASFSSHAVDVPRLQRLISAGLVAEPVKSPGLLDVAFRLGRGLDMLRLHQLAGPGAPSMEEIIRDAMAVQLTPRDQQALGYIRRRGEVYMRRPAQQATGGVQRALSQAEINAFRAATVAAVEGRQSPAELARALRDAASAVAAHPPADRAAVREHGVKAVGPEIVEAMAARTLQNDMERVAVTELAYAHSWGAYEALRAQAAEAGMADPQVFKLVAPGACHDCKRIWGPPSAPHHFLLSYVEAREADGGNFGKSRAEWGPVIGPVHPRCTEGPLQVWTPKLVEAINDLAQQLLAEFKK